MDRLEEGNKIVWKDIIVLFVCSFNKYLLGLPSWFGG